KDNSGKVYKGTVESDNEKALRDKLRGMGLYVSSVARQKNVFSFKLKQKVKSGDLVLFVRQFSTLISAGISITKCLYALEKQTVNPTLKTAIGAINSNIEGGASLSEAMEEYPNIFSEFFIALIKAAETAGILDKVLMRLAEHLEKEDSLKRSIKNAFSYPIVVGSLAFLVVVFLVIVIIPIFYNIYVRLNLTLPLPTLALVAISNFVRRFWWILLAVAVLAVIGYRRFNEKPFFREKIDLIKMNMPLFGNLLKRAAAARFVRTFGDMISSGIMIMESLKIADKVADNKLVSNLVERITENVQKGGTVSEALTNQNILPPAVVQMMSSGEESGSLDFMLEKSAEGLERDVDDIVKRLVIKIEPLMTFFMAILVGFIAIAIYLPIFDVIREMTVQ
ncbi:MAG: type II secretion system F family protein, partial [Candidatus Omnitrophica bacterium]|nr:type II secretion system F family protein [Candidatus Omnitrophota bacterium]